MRPYSFFSRPTLPSKFWVSQEAPHATFVINRSYKRNVLFKMETGLVSVKRMLVLPVIPDYVIIVVAWQRVDVRLNSPEELTSLLQVSTTINKTSYYTAQCVVRLDAHHFD